MNRRTFMKLLPALSAFPSIAEAVVETNGTAPFFRMIKSGELKPAGKLNPIWRWDFPFTYDDFIKVMEEAFKYSGAPRIYHLNGEWHKE